MIYLYKIAAFLDYVFECQTVDNSILCLAHNVSTKLNFLTKSTFSAKNKLKCFILEATFLDFEKDFIVALIYK